MLSRLIIIVMLVLLPLQWSAAQGHELHDDMRDASQQVQGASFAVKADLGHTQDPGGICQFHQLAHAPAIGLDSSHLVASTSCGGWSAASTHLGAADTPLSDIERPKWEIRNSVAATL